MWVLGRWRYSCGINHALISVASHWAVFVLWDPVIFWPEQENFRISANWLIPEQAPSHISVSISPALYPLFSLILLVLLYNTKDKNTTTPNIFIVRRNFSNTVLLSATLKSVLLSLVYFLPLSCFRYYHALADSKGTKLSRWYSKQIKQSTKIGFYKVPSYQSKNFFKSVTLQISM